MISVFYFDVLVVALCGLWLVWFLGFRPLFLDVFRERVFELRLYLFNLAEQGVVSFDDDAYRAIETMMNGCIRFAHRLTFPAYLMSRFENSRARREDKDYVDFGNLLMLKISRTKPEAQEEIKSILEKLHTAISVYMAATSFVFKLCALVYVVVRIFRPEKAKEEVTQRVYVVERDIYLSAKGKYGSAVTA